MPERAAGFSPELDGAKMSRGSLLRRFLPYYRKYLPTLACDLLCASLTTLCELVLPMIVRRITQAATSPVAGDLTPSLIWGCGGLYVVLRLVDTAANYYMASVGHIMGTRMETDMRHDMFGHLQKLSFSYYDNAKVGTLMSRITGDLFDITEFAHHGPEQLFIAFFKIVCSFAILCTINVPLTFIVFAVVPPMALTLAVFRRKLQAGFRESRRQTGYLNAQIEDSLLGIRVVKSFAREAVEQAKFDQGNSRYFGIKKRVYLIMGGFQSSTRLFDGLMYIVVVVVAGALFMKDGSITAADYVAYLLFVTTFLNSVRTLVDFTEQFQRGMTGIERFSEVMDVQPDIVDRPGAVSIERAKGAVAFRDVTFNYGEGRPDVIRHLSLEVKPGENVALVGPSGGGKTTLCALIPRFYDVTGGAVTVDGLDVRDLAMDSLRRNVGLVAQDVYMFSGTVRENIAYGRPGATEEEIREAARLAGALPFVEALPQGFDTYVGERGVKLSGGQKQRLSIARVFLKDPPILILDEATSALDNESERLVQQSLERLSKGRTTLTIAHRLTTVRNADRILVLTPEGIVEEGRHQDLLALKGVYAGMWGAGE